FQKSLPAGQVVANTCGGRFVVQAFRPSVGRYENHRAGTTLEPGVKRVITGVPRPVAVDVDGEVGVWPPGQYWAVPGRGGGCTESRIGRRHRLRDVPPHEQMGLLVAS